MASTLVAIVSNLLAMASVRLLSAALLVASRSVSQPFTGLTGQVGNLEVPGSISQTYEKQCEIPCQQSKLAITQVEHTTYQGLWMTYVVIPFIKDCPPKWQVRNDIFEDHLHNPGWLHFVTHCEHGAQQQHLKGGLECVFVEHSS